jgi:hypothetical protein
MPRVNPGPPCQVCGEPSQAKNLCEKHYRRWKRHGHVEVTRPSDWGARESNPLYSQWTWTNRVTPLRDEIWNDFYAFLADVGERPSSSHRLKRRDIKKGFGPDNWYWKQQVVTDPASLSRAADYQRKWRAENLVRSKGYNLKRHFGLTLQEYEEMERAQGGACAVCGKPEHVVDKAGRLRNLAVDHCHKTGKIRGLLCTNCNKALGHFKDDPVLLQRAIEYLSA